MMDSKRGTGGTENTSQKEGELAGDNANVRGSVGNGSESKQSSDNVSKQRNAPEYTPTIWNGERDGHVNEKKDSLEYIPSNMGDNDSNKKSHRDSSTKTSDAFSKKNKIPKKSDSKSSPQGNESSPPTADVASIVDVSSNVDIESGLGNGDEIGSTPNNDEMFGLPRPPRQEAQPGAFHSEDGRNARDASVVHLHDEHESRNSTRSLLESRTTTADSPTEEVSATLVDVDEENRKVQERVDKEVQEALERRDAELENNAEVAEVVTGFWCSPRTKRIIALLVIAAIVAVVLGITLPIVLEPEAPDPLPGLTELLSSVSLDGGEALSTPETPQYNALRWLAINNTNLDSYSDEKKIQRYSLASLYFSTNGEEWRNNDGWLSDADECSSWFNDADGDQCTSEGALTKLNLPLNKLNGDIPLEIALLSNSLAVLDLSRNILLDTIPSEIGLLSRLNRLILTRQLTPGLKGMIPSEIGLLVHLNDTIALDSNALTGVIPSELGRLKAIRTLRLSKNELTAVLPSEIGGMENLQSLVLSDNFLSADIPSEVGLLQDLEALSLDGNALSGTIPSEIGTMTSLVSLRLHKNNLKDKIPSEFGLLPMLDTLNLYRNDISGSIPSEIGLASNLSLVQIYDTMVSGRIPSEMGVLTYMKELYLFSNRLTGFLPSEIGNLGDLNELYLHHNSLSGTILSEFAVMTELKDLRLFNNSFVGLYTCPIVIAECYVSCVDRICQASSDCTEPQALDSPCRSL